MRQNQSYFGTWGSHPDKTERPLFTELRNEPDWYWLKKTRQQLAASKPPKTKALPDRAVVHGDYTEAPVGLRPKPWYWPLEAPPTDPADLTVEMIQRAVCQYFGLTLAEVKAKRRTMKVVWPRQIAHWLCLRFTSRSLLFIARQFGGQDHTTVIHSKKKIDGLTDHPDVVALLRLLEGDIGRAEQAEADPNQLAMEV